MNVVVKTCPDTLPFNALCALNASRFPNIISNILILLLIIAVIIALFFLIWGGIKWILSGGDKAALEGARSHIIAAIVGLIIAFLAFFIISVILQIFGVNDTSFKLPSINN